MSLKAFHIFFIVLSVIFAVGVAVWALQNTHWLLALVSLASSAALVVYLDAFRRKASTIGLP